MSYLIDCDTGKVVGITFSTRKSGENVRYAYRSVNEWVNADIDLNLVNARGAKISNAKKYDKHEWVTPYVFQVNLDFYQVRGGEAEFLVQVDEDGEDNGDN